MTIKNFTFVATTGRSGSESLANILRAGKEIHVEHESEPVMYNNCPAGLPDSQSYYRNIFYQEKLPVISNSASGCAHYAETNHQFIKHFADYAIDTFAERTRIIHLYRDPVSVAMSFYRIGSIPGKSERGKLYLLDPASNDNLLDMHREFTAPEFDDDIYRCLWYWYEIEARIRQYKSSYPNILFHKMETEQLNDYNSVRNLFHELEIEFEVDKLKAAIGTRSNQKESDKKHEIDRGYAEELNQKLHTFLSNKYKGKDKYLIDRL